MTKRQPTNKDAESGAVKAAPKPPASVKRRPTAEKSAPQKAAPAKPAAPASDKGSKIGSVKGGLPTEVISALLHANRNSARKPGEQGGARNLSKRQVDAIRQLAVAMACPDIGSDDVMICNPITEPPAIPLSELLYDRCRWCQTDIYYDRLMPSPPGLTRVCVPCGIMLLEADKKGAN